MVATCTCFPHAVGGYEYNEFIAENFHECLYSPKEIASFFVGMSSILFWIICCAPQLWQNYRQKSAKALSKWFLLEWFLGDALNLLGALLTRQLVTQVATGVLFAVNDLLMLAQLVYYGIYGTNKKLTSTSANGVQDDSSDEFEDDDSDTTIEERRLANNDGIGNASSAQDAALFAAAMLPLVFSIASSSSPGVVPISPFSSIKVADLSNDSLPLPSCENHYVDAETEKMGMVVGWISSVVYLNSRIPQIIKNHKRRSVEGLSFLLFTSAVLGNTSYGLGILLKDSRPSQIKKALPWLVGSLGTLILDFTILFQFCLFYDQPAASERRLLLESVEAENDNSIGGFEAQAQASESPELRGIFGIRAWETSPFYKPRSAIGKPTPLHWTNTENES